MDSIAVKVDKQGCFKPYLTGLDFVFCFNKDSYQVSQSFYVEDKTFAPEMMAGVPHGQATDVWGLGRIASGLLALAICPDDHPLCQLAQSMVDDEQESRPTMISVANTLESIIYEQD